MKLLPWVIAMFGCASVAFACAGTSIAASDVMVNVIDDATALPVRAARVTLIGTGPGESRTALADGNGRVELSGFGPGAIRLIVSADGYPVYRSVFDLPERLVYPLALVVRLDRLEQIGRTSARPSATSAQRTIGENSPVRRVSSDLVDALSRLGGVAVVGNANLTGIALRGHDPSQTKFTLSGTPVGVNAAQLAIDSDLLQEAQVTSAQDTVAFALLAPTLDAVQKADATVGGYGSSLVRSSLQGTTGQVGYAFAHVARGADSILNGRVYEDLSGMRYRHVGELVKLGDYAKLAVPIGYWSVSASDAVSRSAGNPLPAYLAGTLPAGIGPGERKTTNAENAIFVANGILHGVSLSFNASSWSYRGYDDASTRVIAHVPAPLVVADTSSGRSVQGYLSTTLGDRRTLELLGTLTWTRASADFADAQHRGSGAAFAAQRSLKATERWKIDDSRSVLASVALDSDSSATLPAFHVEERLRRRNTDRSLSLDYARKPVRSDSPENIRALFDPRSASYDCHGRLITANVPGDGAAQPTVLGANASLATHSRRSHLQTSAYYELQHDLLLTGASVRSAGGADGALGSFVNELLHGYASFGGCSGTVGVADVVFIRNVTGVSARYDGIEVTAGTNLGSRLVLEGDLAFQQAVATSLPASLSSLHSYYVAGRQLPNVPYWNGNLSLDWQSSDGRTEALMNATLTSINNPKNLPNAAVFSVALQRTVSPRLSLTVVGTNVTKTYTGDFVSARYATPYRLANGILQSALAAPEPPPRLFVSLSYRNR